MPQTQLTISHQLGTEEAKRRILHLLHESKSKLAGKITDVEEDWVENTGQFRCKIMGMALAGILQIDSTEVTLVITLPLAALPWKSRLEKDLLIRARKLLT